MEKNRIFLIFSLFFLLPFVYQCNTSEVKIKEKLPCDCKGDSIKYYVIETFSDLSKTDSVFLYRYEKNKKFNKLKKEKKYLIDPKTFDKNYNRWAIHIEDPINLNYDYLFVIPQQNDSDYYYVSGMKLFYVPNRDTTDYTCYLSSYYVNGNKMGPTSLILSKPLKKRNPLLVRVP
jgi:hypothetical protein